METVWFYEILIFQVVIVMVKDKKYGIKHAKPGKTILIHYLKWTRVMLQVVSKELELVCIFFAIFSFHFNCQSVKGQLS